MNFTTKLVAFAALLYSGSLVAQFKVDSVSIGGSANPSQSYYDFRTGVKGTAPILNWDICMTADPRDAALKANHMTGLRVYKYPKSNQTGWTNFDTAGWKNWPKSYNDLHNHNKGAFNSYNNNPSIFYFGWGHYLGAPTNEVQGDSLFLLVWLDQTETPVMFKKFYPIKVVGSPADFYFKAANVDGSSETTDTLFMSQANSQNYRYYKFSNDSKPVREPNKATWDITFTRYYDFVQGQYYPVMGVEGNRGTLIAKITDQPWMGLISDTAKFNKRFKDSLKNDLTGIGSDWKFFDGTKYVFDDNRSYIVRSIRNTSDTIHYLVHFTNFVGGNTGKSFFNFTPIDKFAGIFSPTFGQINIFPNPVSNVLYITAADVVFGNATLSLTDVSGKEVMKMNINQDNKFGAYQINTTSFAKGIYFVNLQNTTHRITQKIVIQ